MKQGGKRLRTQEAVSAGGVVYRCGPEGVEIALCGRHAAQVWALPKGTPEPGETLEQTAVREVREETGLRTTVVRSLGQIEYWFSRPAEGVRFHKVVHHYLLRYIDGDVADHDGEYDEVRWFPACDVEHALTYPNEAEIVRRALEALAGDLACKTASSATRVIEGNGRDGARNRR